MNPTNEQDAARLREHGIRPTALRIMILRALSGHGRPVTAQEVEIQLDTVDRSTITRALALFLQKGLVHVVEDGSGVPKYEPCPSPHSHVADDAHAHFHCKVCGRTLCIEQLRMPLPILPDGFSVDSISCIIAGTCPDCAEK